MCVCSFLTSGSDGCGALGWLHTNVTRLKPVADRRTHLTLGYGDKSGKSFKLFCLVKHPSITVRQFCNVAS